MACHLIRGNIANDFLYLNPQIMNSFIEDYLSSPISAVSSAQKRAQELLWISDVDDEMIYEALASGQFRLYEAIVFCSSADDQPERFSVRPVA